MVHRCDLLRAFENLVSNWNTIEVRSHLVDEPAFVLLVEERNLDGEWSQDHWHLCSPNDAELVLPNMPALYVGQGSPKNALDANSCTAARRSAKPTGPTSPRR